MSLGFTVKNSYSLSTHYVEFDHTNMYVKLTSNNSTVKTLGLGGGIDIRVNSGNFEIGTITGWNGSFNRTIDFNLTDAGLLFDAVNNKCIGGDDLDDSQVTRYEYQISASTCPLHIIKNNSTQIVTLQCPCDLANCSSLNAYYTQVN